MDEIVQAALAAARRVTLVDWYEEVPRTLLAAGYEVGGVGADGDADRCSVEAVAPTDVERGVFPPKPGHPGYLVCRPCEPPKSTDIVGTYRPKDEHLEIVRRVAIPLHARWFWVERGDDHLADKGEHPPVEGTSDAARAECEAVGIIVIEGQSFPSAVAEFKRRRGQA